MFSQFKAVYSIFGQLLLAFLVTFLISCKKDPSAIGINVQPDSDRITVIKDTVFYLDAYTMKEDSISSDERTISPLGSYADPIFGKATAGFVTNFRLSANNVVLGGTLDSVCLTLSIKGSYGNKSISPAPHRIKVFELFYDLKTTDTLYSTFKMDGKYYPSSPLADVSYTIGDSDTEISLKLDTSIGWKIIKAPTSYLVSADEFVKYFQGLYVTIDSNVVSNRIHYVDLLAATTKLKVYYKPASDPNVQKIQDLIVDSKCARVSMFQHNYSGTPFSAFTNTGADRVYLQSMSGPRAFLKIPEIAAWQAKGISVNKAELIMQVDSLAGAENFDIPSRLFLVISEANGKYKFMDDYTYNKTYFGGYYSSATRSYKFNIPIYVQDLATGKIQNNGLFLFNDNNRTSANRVVLMNSGAFKMKVKVSYTKI